MLGPNAAAYADARIPPAFREEPSHDPDGRKPVPCARHRRRTPGPLKDLKVLDIATLFAGPSAATIMADFGADVLKIEHPTRPDGARTHGKSKDGKGLWWTLLARNKRTPR